MPHALFLDHQIRLESGLRDLADTGYTTYVAVDIDHALELLNTHSMDLIVLNPETLGAGQLLAMLETREAWAGIPLILYTDDPSHRLLLSAGVRAVVFRRRRIDGLIGILDKVMRQPRMRRRDEPAVSLSAPDVHAAGPVAAHSVSASMPQRV